jgi:chemotaxis protein methyltransferase CheR
MVEWSTPQMARVAELVRERTGLVFPLARQAEVESAIGRAMERRGIDRVERLAELLGSDDHAREALVAELTIGESYFQRDPAQFELLRWQILPELLAARAPDRPIRVWSAGCASGEEPYTVAMVFDELGAASRAHIIGTDIARSRLEAAQRGLYSKWALRNSTEEVRSRYFTARGRYYELAPRIRERVDFRYLNLAEDRFPSLSTGIWGMDVILCRNVLIYFDAPTVERVARRLIASLSEDGWLLTGASDPPVSELVECDVVLTDAGLAYRRPGTARVSDVRRSIAPADLDAGTHDGSHPPAFPVPAWPSPGVTEGAAEPWLAEPTSSVQPTSPAEPTSPREPTSPAEPTSAAADANAAILAAYEARDFDGVRVRAASAEAAGSLGVAGWTAWLRSVANQGRLEEAAEIARRALAAHGTSAELLYLHSVVLLQGGQAQAAAVVARRALYADRQLVVAHLALAEAARQAGLREESRRALRNAAALLEKMPPDSVVPASDGEHAGRLAELIRVKARLLEDAV